MKVNNDKFKIDLKPFFSSRKNKDKDLSAESPINKESLHDKLSKEYLKRELEAVEPDTFNSKYADELINMVEKGKRLSSKELAELLKTYKENKYTNEDKAIEARDKIVNSFLKLAISLTKKSHEVRKQKNIPFNETLQEAISAIYDSLDKYEGEHLNVKFAMKKRLFEFFGFSTAPLHIAYSVKYRNYIINQTVKKLRKLLNRYPSEDEVKKDILKQAEQRPGLKSYVTNNVRQSKAEFIPVILQDEEGNQLTLPLKDNNETGFDRLSNKETEKAFIDLINQLPPFERDLLAVSGGMMIEDDDTGNQVLDNFFVEDEKEPLKSRLSFVSDLYGEPKDLAKVTLRKIRKKLAKLEGYDRLLDILSIPKQQKQFTKLLNSIKTGDLDEDKALIVKNFIQKTTSLSGKEKNFLFKRYFDGGKSIKTIADEEKLYHSIVYKQVNKALSKLDKPEITVQIENLLRDE